MHSFRTRRGYRPATRILASFIIAFFLSNELFRSVAFASTLTGSFTTPNEENKVEFQTSLLTTDNAGRLPIQQPSLAPDSLFNPEIPIQLKNLPLSNFNFEQKEQNNPSFPYIVYDSERHSKTVFLNADEKFVYEEVKEGEFRIKEMFKGLEHAIYRFEEGKLAIVLEGQNAEYREEFVYQWDDQCQGANCQISSAQEKLNPNEHFDITLNFSTGWNFFSNPFAEAISLKSSMADFMTSVWGWNNEAKKYVKEREKLEPGKAYWVWVDEAGERKFEGQKVININQQLSVGWNLIGSSYGSPRLQSVIDTNQVISPLWDWKDGSYKSYIIDESLIFSAGKGFWINVRQPTEFKLARQMDPEILLPLTFATPDDLKQVDRMPPKVTLTSPSLTNNPNYTLLYTVDEKAYTEPLTLNEGKNTIGKTLIDEAGNKTNVSWDVVLDSIAPVMKCLTDIPAVTKEHSITIEYLVDGVAKSRTFNFTKDEQFQDAVTEVDEAGNKSVLPVELLVDWTAPSTGNIETTLTTITHETNPIFRFSADEPSVFSYRLSKAGTVINEWLQLDTNTLALSFKSDGSADGTYTLQVKARDEIGNEEDSPASFTWTLDTQAPAVKLMSPTLTNVSGYRLVYTVDGVESNEQITLKEGENTIHKIFKDNAGNETNVSWDVVLDSTAPVMKCLTDIPAVTKEHSITIEYLVDGVAKSRTFNFTKDGQFQDAVTEVDEAGNKSALPVELLVDWTAPSTGNIETTLTTITHEANPKFSFTADEPSVFSYRLSKAGTLINEWTPTDTNTLALSFKSDGSADGTYTLQVKARDEIGNEEDSPASFTWTLDTQAPAVKLMSPTLTNVSGYRLVYTVDGVESSELITIKEGENTIQKFFKDSAGNETNVNWKVKLDTVLPTGSISASGQDITANSNVSVILKAEDKDSGVQSMRFSQDNMSTWSAWENFSGAKNFELPQKDGYYNIWAEFRDFAGNVLRDVEQFHFDTTAPINPLYVNKGSAYTKLRGIFLERNQKCGTVYSYYLCFFDGEEEHEVTYSLDAGKIWSGWRLIETTNYFRTDSYIVVLLPSGDGQKEIQYRIRDMAGNESKIFTNNIVLDTTPPVGSVQMNGGNPFTNHPNIDIALSVNDATSGLAQSRYSLDQGKTWTNWMPFQNQWSATFTNGDGNKKIMFEVMDKAGNKAQFSSEMTLDTDLPKIVILSTIPNVTKEKSLTVQYQVSDQGVVQIKSWTFTLTNEGLFFDVITETDSAGNVGTMPVSLTVDRTPPEIQILTTILKETNQKSMTLEYTVDGSLKSKTFELKNGDGDYTLEVSGSDDVGNEASLARKVTLDTKPPQIIFTSSNHAADPVYQLTYTVDGVSNTETRILSTEGDNELKVTKRDDAGNEITAPFTVILNSTSTTEPVDPETEFHLVTQNGEILNYLQDRLSSINLTDGTLVSGIELNQDGALKSAVAHLSNGSIQILSEDGGLIYRRPDGSHLYYTSGKLRKEITKDGEVIVYSYPEGSSDVFLSADAFEARYDSQGRLKYFFNKKTVVISEFVDGVLSKIKLGNGDEIIFKQVLQNGLLVVTPMELKKTSGGTVLLNADNLPVEAYRLLQYDPATHALVKAVEQSGKTFLFDTGTLKKILGPDGGELADINQSASELAITHNGTISIFNNQNVLSSLELNGLTIHYQDNGAIAGVDTREGDSLTNLSFDQAGKLTGAEAVDSKGNIQTYVEGELIKSVDPTGQVLFFEDGKLTHMVTKDGIKYNFHFEVGEIKAEIDPSFITDAVTITKMSFDSGFNLKEEIKANGEIIKFLNNRLFSVTPPQGEAKVYSYERDGDGKILSTTVTQGNVEMTLDALNQPLRSTIRPTTENPHTLQVIYRYGKIREITKDGVLTFTYSYQLKADGIEQTIVRDLEENATRTYEKGLLVTSLEEDTSLLSTYDYADEKVTRITVTRFGKPWNVYTYFYQEGLTIVTDTNGTIRAYDGQQKLIRKEQNGEVFRYTYHAPSLLESPLTTAATSSGSPADQGEIINEELVQKRLSDGSIAHYENGIVTRIDLSPTEFLTDITLDEVRQVTKATLNLPDGTKKVFNQTEVLEEISPDGTHFFFSEGRIGKVIQPDKTELVYSYEMDDNGAVQFIWIKKGDANLKYDAAGHLLGLKLEGVTEGQGAGEATDFYRSSLHEFSGQDAGNDPWQSIDQDSSTAQVGTSSNTDPNYQTRLYSTHTFDAPKTVKSISFKMSAQSNASGTNYTVVDANLYIYVLQNGVWQTVNNTYEHDSWGGKRTEQGPTLGKSSFRELVLDGLDLKNVTAIQAHIYADGTNDGNNRSVNETAQIYEIYAEVENESGAPDLAYYSFKEVPNGDLMFLGTENPLAAPRLRPNQSITPMTMPILPGLPHFVILKPSANNVSTALDNLGQRGFVLNYATDSDGDVGAGFIYKNIAPANTDFYNLSGLSELVFSLRGDEETVKLEIIDRKQQKASVMLTGISPVIERVWSIPTEFLKNVDLSEIHAMNFIVEGKNKQGTLEVNRFPTSALSNPIVPSADLSVTIFPEKGLNQASVIEFFDDSYLAATGGTIESFANGAALSYDVSEPLSEAALDLNFDDPDTRDVLETADLSFMNSFVIGVSSNGADLVGMELTDSHGISKVKQLVLVNGTTQYYRVDLSELSRSNLDLEKIKQIRFSVANKTANQLEGAITVQFKGVHHENPLGPLPISSSQDQAGLLNYRFQNDLGGMQFDNSGSLLKLAASGFSMPPEIRGVIDSSSSQYYVGTGGNTAINTSQEIFGNFNARLDGNGDFLFVQKNKDFEFGLEDFTIETDALLQSLPANGNQETIFDLGGVGTRELFLKLEQNNGKYQFHIKGGFGNDYYADWSPDVNAWHHIALSREGVQLRLFIDGKLLTSFENYTNFVSQTDGIRFGAAFDNTAYFNGLLDEIRISRGISRYSTAFTLPNERFTSDEHTKLLLHFDDEALNAKKELAKAASSLSGSIQTLTTLPYLSKMSTRIGNLEYQFGTLTKVDEGGLIQTYSTVKTNGKTTARITEDGIAYDYDEGGTLSEITIQNLPFNIEGSKDFSDVDSISPTVTSHGDTHLTTQNKVFGEAAASFDGNGDDLSLPNSPDFDFGTGDFTVDFQVRFNALTTYTLYSKNAAGTGGIYIQWTPSGGDHLTVALSTAVSLTFPWTPVTNTWYHVAVTRSGNSIRAFVNGSQIGSTQTDSTDITSTAAEYVGSHLGSSQFFDGWIDELRVSKGIARWTSNFTPPTQEYAPDAYTKLLFHFDGNNSTSHSVEGSKDFSGDDLLLSSIASSGDAFLTTQMRKFGGAAVSFDGSGDYLSIPKSPDFDFGTGDFTVDAWVNFSDFSQARTIFSHGTNGSNYMTLWLDSGNNLIFQSFGGGGNNFVIERPWTPSVNGWYHLAIIRNGNTLYLTADGKILGTGQACNGSIGEFTGTFQVGGDSINSRYIKGEIDEFRVSKGIARWTGNFTPLAQEYTTDAYTKLLLHFNGKNPSAYSVEGSKDFSSDNGTPISTITNYGDTHLTQDKVFGEASVQFDGSGDYLTTPQSNDFNFGTGDFTIDFWVNPGENFDDPAVVGVGNWNNGILVKSYGQLIVYFNSAVYFDTKYTLQRNQWQHVALVRNGNTLRVYVNGRQVGSDYDVSGRSMSNLTQGVTLGYIAGHNRWFNGKIDEFRISGIARWTGNFTPPAQEYTTDTATKLLLHFNGNNPADYSEEEAKDFSGDNVVPLSISNYGDAQLTQNKVFGEASVQFDGSGDYLTIPKSNDFNFGTGDVTIDFWVNPGENHDDPVVAGVGDWNNGILLKSYGTLIVYFSSASYFDTKYTLQRNQWQHVAVVRNGNTLRVYVNGRQVGSDYDVSGRSMSNLTQGVTLGYIAGHNQWFNGKIDEFRVSGIARWTSNFTPPVEEYKQDAYTKLLLHFNGNNPTQYTVEEMLDSAGNPTQYLVQGSSGRFLFDVSGQLIEEDHLGKTNSVVLAAQNRLMEQLKKNLPQLRQLPYQDKLNLQNALTPALGQRFQTAVDSILNAQTVVSQEYSSNGILETQTRADQTVMLFNDSNQPAELIDETGNTLIEYTYDTSGNLEKVYLKSARDALPKEIYKARESILTQRNDILRRLLEEKKISTEEIMRNAQKAREQVYDFLSRIQSEMNRIGTIKGSGKAFKNAKADALNALNGYLAQGHNSLSQIAEAEGKAYADLDSKVKEKKDEIDTEAGKAFQNLYVQDVNLKQAITKQEVSPVIYDTYRRILGRDPTTTEYNTWIDQVDYVTGELFVDPVAAKKNFPGPSIHFDGIDDYLEIKSTSIPSSAWVMDFWIKPERPATVDQLPKDNSRPQTIWSQGADAKNYIAIQFTNEERLRFEVISDGKEVFSLQTKEHVFPSPSSLGENAWQHVALWYHLSSGPNKWGLSIWLNSDIQTAKYDTSEVIKNYSIPSMTRLGRGFKDENHYAGFLDEFRISAADWTMNIAHPATQEIPPKDVDIFLLRENLYSIIPFTDVSKSAHAIHDFSGARPDAEHTPLVRPITKPLLKTVESYLLGSDEIKARRAFVTTVQKNVKTLLNEYLIMTDESKRNFYSSFGLDTNDVVPISEKDIQMIFTHWQNEDGTPKTLHFGQSAFLALEALLDQNGIIYTREGLAVKAILIDILSGIITPLDSGDLMISMFALMKVAKWYGLNTQGYHLVYDDLVEVFKEGTAERLIAHISGNHYVIVTYAGKKARMLEGAPTGSATAFARDKQGNIIYDDVVTFIDPGVGPDKQNETFTVTKESFIKEWDGSAMVDQTLNNRISAIQLSPDSRPLTVQETKQIRGAFWGSLFRFLGAMFAFIPGLQPLAIIFNFASAITDIVNGNWLAGISSIVTLGFSQFSFFGDFLKGAFQQAAGFFAGLIDSIPFIHGITSFLTNAFNGVRGVVLTVRDGLKGFLQNPLVKIGLETFLQSQGVPAPLARLITGSVAEHPFGIGFDAFADNTPVLDPEALDLKKLIETLAIAGTNALGSLLHIPAQITDNITRLLPDAAGRIVIDGDWVPDTHIPVTAVFTDSLKTLVGLGLEKLSGALGNGFLGSFVEGLGTGVMGQVNQGSGVPLQLPFASVSDGTCPESNPSCNIPSDDPSGNGDSEDGSPFNFWLDLLRAILSLFGGNGEQSSHVPPDSGGGVPAPAPLIPNPSQIESFNFSVPVSGSQSAATSFNLKEFLSSLGLEATFNSIQENIGKFGKQIQNVSESIVSFSEKMKEGTIALTKAGFAKAVDSFHGILDPNSIETLVRAGNGSVENAVLNNTTVSGVNFHTKVEGLEMAYDADLDRLTINEGGTVKTFIHLQRDERGNFLGNFTVSENSSDDVNIIQHFDHGQLQGINLTKAGKTFMVLDGLDQADSIEIDDSYLSDGKLSIGFDIPNSPVDEVQAEFYFVDGVLVRPIDMRLGHDNSMEGFSEKSDTAVIDFMASLKDLLISAFNANLTLAKNVLNGFLKLGQSINDWLSPSLYDKNPSRNVSRLYEHIFDPNISTPYYDGTNYSSGPSIGVGENQVFLYDPNSRRTPDGYVIDAEVAVVSNAEKIGVIGKSILDEVLDSDLVFDDLSNPVVRDGLNQRLQDSTAAKELDAFLAVLDIRNSIIKTAVDLFKAFHGNFGVTFYELQRKDFGDGISIYRWSAYVLNEEGHKQTIHYTGAGSDNFLKERLLKALEKKQDH